MEALKNNPDNRQEKSNNISHSLFCYEIDNKRVLIEPEIQMEVLEETNVYPVPNAPKWYSGVTSLRGDILVVANMHFLLNAVNKQENNRLLRLKHPSFPPIVLVIDTLPYQIDIAGSEESNKKNEGEFPRWIKYSITKGKNTFLYSDHSILFKSIQNKM